MPGMSPTWETLTVIRSRGVCKRWLAYPNFYFDVGTMDYRKMARAMIPLEKRMKGGDKVEIKGPGTDLTFSIKGIGAKSCNGRLNIPDGEVFSCPVKS